MRFHLIILVIYVSCFLMFRTEGKYISGILKSDSDWQFLTKFCFSPSSGSLQFNMKYPVTCTEKESKLTPSDLQLFRLRPGNNDIPGLDCKTVRNGSQLQCNSQKFSFNSARPRWWYIVISNCNTRNGLLIEYEMWMRNGEIGNIFREHFSADEIYILEFNIAFFVLQLVLLILAALVAVRLRRKQLLHRTYKLYLLSLSLTLLSTLFCCITYLSYGSTAAALQSGGTLAQQLLVLLLGLGYSVTCGRLPAWATALISALLTALTAGYTALFAVEAASADPGLVYWRWSSLPGYCLIGLQLAACLAFAACAGRTLARHRAKRSFYGPLLAVYTVWQLCLPAGAAVCAAWVPAFMRARVASGIDLCLMFIAQLAFLLLAWPAIGNPCFPYDLKTSQIGAITYEDAEERAAVGRDLGAGGDIDVHGGGGGGGGGGLGGMGKLACDPLPDGRPFAQFSLSQSRSFIGVPANNSSS
uniref:GpcrRhopsn4 domain-containing protein n=1 Tax=Macrostomum lignano TaxID=282301 RepID=A0A1I8I7Z6_9PLAT